MPIRYIYQELGKYFYEDFHTVLKIVKAACPRMSDKSLKLHINNNKNKKYFPFWGWCRTLDEELLNDELRSRLAREQADVEQKIIVQEEIPASNTLEQIKKNAREYKIASALSWLCLRSQKSVSVKPNFMCKLSNEAQQKIDERIKQLAEHNKKEIIEIVELLEGNVEGNEAKSGGCS